MLRTAAIMVAAAAALGLAPRTAQAQLTTVTCESYEGQRQVCGADTRNGVRLVDQLSDRACVGGRTWGYTRNAIWVSGGCRARFQVGSSTRYSRGTNYNDNYDNNYGNAVPNGARLCQQAAAERLGVRRGRVQATQVNASRNNARYRWVGAGHQGTCRFDRNGNVTVSMSR
ncbi:MAG TPA: DUF3011 domain-containing protein [Longimicrobium sp.]